MLWPSLWGLAERLSELSLPGGTKAKFGKQLDAARQKAEPIAAKSKRPKAIAGTTSADPYLMLAKQFPAAAVIEAFKEIEAVIGEYSDRVPGAKKIWIDTLRPLLVEGFLSQEDIDLFHRLRNMRNTAVHAGTQQRITGGEAIEFGTAPAPLRGRFGLSEVLALEALRTCHSRILGPAHFAGLSFTARSDASRA